MVTHDPEEAMYLADRIAVMERGKILQIGSPDEIYLSPANAFVAAFFGDVNRFSGPVNGGQVGTPIGNVSATGYGEGTIVDVMIRPEALSVSLDEAENGTNGVVAAARFLGRSSLVDVRLDDSHETTVRVHIAGRFLPEMGLRVWVDHDNAQTYVFNAIEGE